MTKRILVGCLLAAMMAVAPLSGAEERTGDAYPLSTCPVSGKELGSMGDPIVAIVDGQEVRFCCEGCKPMYQEDTAKFEAKLDEQATKNQDEYYPGICVNTGEKLGDNAEAFVIGNRLMKTCCKNCKATVEEAPAAAFEKLDAAVTKAQGEDYPLETCVVSGEKLGSMGEPIEVVMANRLVKLCCAGCEKALDKDPAKYIGTVDEARAAGTSQEKAAG